MRSEFLGFKSFVDTAYHDIFLRYKTKFIMYLNAFSIVSVFYSELLIVVLRVFKVKKKDASSVERMNSRREKQATKKIAQERIEILLTLADGIYSEDPELGQRYGDLARKIVMKARIRMPEKWRIRFCRKCKKFLYPGITTHVRIKSSASSRVVYYCDICNVGKKSKQISKSQ